MTETDIGLERSMPASQRAQAGERLLIVAHTTTFLTELSLFGKLVRNRTDAEVVFYCPFVHWTANEFAKSCEAEGVTCLLNPLRESLPRFFPLSQYKHSLGMQLRLSLIHI